jgi:hypothetical protein
MGYLNDVNIPVSASSSPGELTLNIAYRSFFRVTKGTFESYVFSAIKDSVRKPEPLRFSFVSRIVASKADKLRKKYREN